MVVPWLRNLVLSMPTTLRLRPPPPLPPHARALVPLPCRFRLPFCSLAPACPPALTPSVSASASASNAVIHDTACRPRLLAPVRHLLSDAVRRGYAKCNSQGLARATSNPKFVAAPDAAIVLHYSAIIRSIVNYYSFVHSRSSLWKVTSVYRKSCALTLARKHRLRSAGAAFSKFGPKLRISSPDSRDDAVHLVYPDSLKTVGKFNMHSPRYSQVAILQEPFEKKRWR